MPGRDTRPDRGKMPLIDMDAPAMSATRGIFLRRGAEIRRADARLSRQGRARIWTACCSIAGMPMDILAGRALAHCAHPFIAWRRLNGSRRALLVFAYFSAGYVSALVMLSTL